MKKAFVIILMVCLTFGMAFAAKSSNLKVGAQVGFGTQAVKVSGTVASIDMSLKAKTAGFYFAGTAEVGLKDALSLKAEAGINTMGDTKTTYVLGSSSTDTTVESSSVQVSAYVGGQYAMELSKEITLNLGVGLDMMFGKLGTEDDAKVNGALGLGFEAVGAYALEKDIALTFGAKFGWHFLNTNDDIADAYGKASANNVGVNNTTFKVFAGATYAL